MSDPKGTTDLLPVFDLDLSGGGDLHPTIGLAYADTGGHKLVSPSDPLPTSPVAASGGLGASDVLGFENNKAVLAAADIFAADLVVPRDGTIVIEHMTSVKSKLRLKVTRSATLIQSNGADGLLNTGADIAIDSWFNFRFAVRSGDLVNLKNTVGATVSSMITFQDTF